MRAYDAHEYLNALEDALTQDIVESAIESAAIIHYTEDDTIKNLLVERGWKAEQKLIWVVRK